VEASTLHAASLRGHRRSLPWWSIGGWAASVGFAVAATDAYGSGCPFRTLTGWDCPGCGATRAGLAIVHGRLVLALHNNALAVVGGLLFTLWIGGRILGVPLRVGDSASSKRWLAGVAIVLVIAWTVFRNTPIGAGFYAGST